MNICMDRRHPFHTYNDHNLFRHFGFTQQNIVVNIDEVERDMEILNGKGSFGSSIGRALDWHAADAGSFLQCSTGFFSQSQPLVQTLLRCPYTPVCNRIYICAHVKDPVVHVRVLLTMETLKHLASTVGWVVWLIAAGFPWEE